MTTDRFELDRAALHALLEENGILDERDAHVPGVVAAWSGDPRFRRASLPVLLAQLTYLLGISTEVARRPDDFPPHCLVGFAGGYHGVDERLMICLCCSGAPFVSEDHTAAIELLEAEAGSAGYGLVEAVCDLLLAHACTLIPAARAAAGTY